MIHHRHAHRGTHTTGGWSSWTAQKRIGVICSIAFVMYLVYSLLLASPFPSSPRIPMNPLSPDDIVDNQLPVENLPSTPVEVETPAAPAVVYTTRYGRSPVTSNINILAQTPHDPSAFTQGLCFYRGELYESTGLNGRSTLRKIDIATGQTLRQLKLKHEYFAEGLTIWRDLIYQLTWNSKVGFVYDLKFQFKRQFALPGEGWGLTHNQRSLIISDGSSNLYFMSPKTFKIKRTLEVREITAKGLQPIEWLNELEYIDGYIWANVWYHNIIVVIHPLTGIVHKKVSLGKLRPNPNQEAVPNGIAFDHQTRQLYITGKLWPHLYRVEFDTLGLTMNTTQIDAGVVDDRELIIDDTGALVQHDS